MSDPLLELQRALELVLAAVRRSVVEGEPDPDLQLRADDARDQLGRLLDELNE